jgi:ribonuclease Z
VAVAGFRLGELSISGVSRAGDQTWFRIQPSGIAFDVGRGAVELQGVDRVFLTHGHLDHALGLPFLLSQRATKSHPPLTVHAPAALLAPLAAFVASCERLEERRYEVEFRGLEVGDRVELGAGLSIEPFAVSHRSVGLGYHLLRTRKRLRPELEGLPGEVIAARRGAGEAVDEERSERWLSYTGDTTAAVFDLAQEIRDSIVLLIECTFFAGRHRQHAASYGHLHLDDLVARQDELRNQAVVLAHLSRRHRVAEFEADVRRRLPLLAGRVHVFGSHADGETH